MMEGAHVGVCNSRGVHWHGEGGDQERELAEKYRKWAQALQFSHPYVSSKLLMGLAETYQRQPVMKAPKLGSGADFAKPSAATPCCREPDRRRTAQANRRR